MIYDPLDPNNDPQEWFDMDAFVRSGRYIGPPELDPNRHILANIDQDANPSPSQHLMLDDEWHLTVYSWGTLIISRRGVRIR